MNLLDAILNEQNGGAVQQLAAQHGIDPQQAQSAISALLPGLTGALQGQVSQGGGALDGLLGMLTSGTGQNYLNDPSQIGSASAIGDGNNILAQILGSKDASRALANQASAQTGIGSDILKQMLPVVASLAMGALSRQTQQSNLAAGAAASPGGAGGLLEMLTPMLDSNRDGSVVDDVLGMASKFLK
ncbi:MAG: DUF937 domain-containing protein [Bryobacterales bacterium]|nr:DUF937 domain-containing protein [Bryobacterales bacterium]